MTTFTKGPWRYSETHGQIISTATGVYRDIICDVEPGIRSRLLPARANARLIAAAPDLYRVLESIVNAKTTDDVYAQFGNAREALAKARGES